MSPALSDHRIAGDRSCRRARSSTRARRVYPARRCSQRSTGGRSTCRRKPLARSDVSRTREFVDEPLAGRSVQSGYRAPRCAPSSRRQPERSGAAAGSAAIVPLEATRRDRREHAYAARYDGDALVPLRRSRDRASRYRHAAGNWVPSGFAGPECRSAWHAGIRPSVPSESAHRRQRSALAVG